jgi:hypothetical protein
MRVVDIAEVGRSSRPEPTGKTRANPARRLRASLPRSQPRSQPCSQSTRRRGARGRSRSNLTSGGLSHPGCRAANRVGVPAPGLALQSDPHDVVPAFVCLPRPRPHVAALRGPSLFSARTRRGLTGADQQGRQKYCRRRRAPVSPRRAGGQLEGQFFFTTVAGLALSVAGFGAPVTTTTGSRRHVYRPFCDDNVLVLVALTS